MNEVEMNDNSEMTQTLKSEPGQEAKVLTTVGGNRLRRG